MLSVNLYWRWIHFGLLLIGLIPGITAKTKYVDTQYSNTSTLTSTSASTSTLTSHSTITSCATLGTLDFFPASLRSLPPSVLASITLSEAVRLQEVLRSFIRLAAQPESEIASVFAQVTSIFTSIQHEVVSDLGSSGYAYLNFPGFTEPCLLSTCVDQFISQGSSFTAANPSGLWVYQAQPPCCGQCSIFANNVELAYWPTPAPTPPITALVNTAANFTFVSPSVYAFFTGLGASDKCGPVGGGTFPFLNLKVAPTDLSTSSILVNPSFSLTFNPLGQWTAINYQDFGPQCICTANCELDQLQNKTLTNLCTPQLSIPRVVTELVPAWATCASDLFGTFDPPIALALADGLTTPKDTTAQPTPSGPGGGSTTSPGPTAAPVNSPNPPLVSPTPTPQPEPSNPPPTQANPNPPAQSNNPPPPVESQPINTQTVNPQPANPQPVNPLPSNPQPVNSPVPVPVQPSSAAPIVPVLPAPITIANTVLTPVPGASPIFIIGSQTLVPGGSAITLNGETISLPPSGSAIIIPGPEPTAPQVLTINGQTVTANAQSNFVIGTQTLIPGGPAITVSGTPISLAPGATQIVVGGTTTPLGGIIISVFNGGSATSSTSEAGGETETAIGGGTTTGVAPAEFTGGAVGKGQNVPGGIFVYIGVVFSVLMTGL